MSQAAQCAELLGALKQRAMTATEIHTELGIARASARVHDLRRDGYVIHSTEVTRVELAALVDDTRQEPAIDTSLFPGVKPRWHWTSTPCAWSSASAWSVNFGYGYVDGLRRSYDGFALAVRRAGQ